MSIDWSLPLETVNGTPVLLAERDGGNPDKAGDYFMVREDGEMFTEQQEGNFPHKIIICRPDGTRWAGRSVCGPLLVRNRQRVIDTWQPDERTVDAVVAFIDDGGLFCDIREHFFPTPVDPDLIEARKLAVEWFRSGKSTEGDPRAHHRYADDIDAGKRDSDDIVQVALIALKQS